MLIDSHAHINSEKMNTNEIVSNMVSDGLECIVNIGTSVFDSQRAVEIAQKFDNVYATVGIHPEYTEELRDQCLIEIEELAKNKNVVAIGEIGLDYHYPGFDKQKQIELFKRQLDIAVRCDLPVTIHTRDAQEDTYEILKEYSKKLNRKGVMHCFSENAEWARKFQELGFYISFAGNITFKKTDRSVLFVVDKDKIMVETDSPYLSPEPLRGRINEPRNVKFTAMKIADELGLDYMYFSELVRDNTKRVFYKIKR